MDFPNFRGVIDGALKPHLAICALGTIRRLPPMLLLGTPGVGKTHFASKLSGILRVPMQSVSFSSATSPNFLSGSSTFWANSSPGRLFSQIAWSAGKLAAANPVILLDEIDKSGTDHRFDPLGSLYALLEINTAKTFEDEGLPDLVIDTQFVSYIATANSIEPIPEPIRSRLVVYEIDPPTRWESQRIAKRMLLDAIADVGVEFSPELPDDVLDDMGDLSPRAIRTRLNVCVGLAIYAGRRHVEPADWHSTRPKAATRPRIGFS